MRAHIRISDRGWILEKMASELSRALPFVSYDTAADASADVQYYLTYSTHQERLSPVEIAYFTHLEEDERAKAKFLDVANQVDYSVCMSHIYADLLKKETQREVRIIGPGVDIDVFRPSLKIGVVGRTYVTGRKGEALVSQVMDLPGIEWFFTGEGWPGPALNLPGDELPEFYRSMDYILVPASFEGGPMSAIEALACGVEVIAPEIGWMPELPHISYRTGDAESLRAVLVGLLEKREALRTSILDRTWDHFAAKHGEFFEEIAQRHNLGSTKTFHAAPEVVSSAAATRVALLTHGAEKSAKGGPSTRIPQLALGLRKHGFDAENGYAEQVGLRDANVVHLFNVATPKTAIPAMEAAKSFKKPVVFSPIFLDNRCRDLWLSSVPKAFEEHSSQSIEERLVDINAEAQRLRRLPLNVVEEQFPGYNAMIGHLVDEADHLVFLSDYERRALGTAIGRDLSGTLVHNPVDASKFSNADPVLFQNLVGLKDYVLCVGRIEPRKNQLLLAYALKGTGIPLVLIGEAIDARYKNLIQAVGGDNVHFAGRIGGQSQMLASAYAGARCFALPSWAEGAPLAALEAAAAGAPLVLSSYSGEEEYFGAHATYADPADVAAIRRAVVETFETRRSAEAVDAQKEHIAGQFSIDRHVERTIEVYRNVLSRAESPSPASPAAHEVAPVAETEAPHIYLDVTTLINNPGRITGITRVELLLVNEIRNNPNITYIAWHRIERRYFLVPPDLLSFEQGPSYVGRRDLETISSLPPNANLLIQGNAWLQNLDYVHDTTLLIRRSGATAILLIHDILPISHPQYFSEETTERFEDNLSKMLANVRKVGTVSQASKNELLKYFSSKRIQMPQISVIREGDGIPLDFETPLERNSAEVPEKVRAVLDEGDFVLTVGSLSPHKNRHLLYQVWTRLVADLGSRAPQLVIVGGATPGPLKDMLERDPVARDKIKILSGIDDNALDLLYRESIFTVFPSLCEGWGLPVGESLAHGKICIASATSSMVEIAPHITDLIDPLDIKAWYQRIRMYAVSSAKRAEREEAIRKDFVPVAWSKTAADLLALSGGPSQKAFELHPFYSGQVADFQDASNLYAYSIPQTNHFVGRNGWGAWADKGSATIAFRLFHTGAGSRSFIAPFVTNKNSLVDVLLNDHLTETWELTQGEVSLCSVRIPDTLRSGDPVKFEFRIRDEDGSTRVLGVSAFTIIEDEWPADRKERMYAELRMLRYELGSELAFGLGQPGLAYLGEGWNEAEPTQVWSRGRAVLSFLVPDTMRRPLDLVIEGEVLQTQDVTFEVAGHVVSKLTMNGRNRHEVWISIPAAIMNNIEALLEIAIIPSKPATPASLGMGKDRRILGFMMQKARLEPSRAWKFSRTKTRLRTIARRGAKKVFYLVRGALKK
ncbi:glycosyltransferase [Microvirga sp. ACRRW]|uniref:glycosyltransferase n=1 Tax=Microvirga sp. ACRRW TaxID=2918205 RepID=UPI001EF7107B|nr:glycosyltransferase [Microvirga sp. ACRRW]MCG7394454.1 glycosyltransferase [Microvirga sp. ACRRW]